jgi:hypothetical protein
MGASGDIAKALSLVQKLQVKNCPEQRDENEWSNLFYTPCGDRLL